jgi:hypothetical protein
MYPTDIITPSTVASGDVITSALENQQSDILVGIETALGTMPQGTFDTVADALVAKANITDVQTNDLVYASDTGTANAYAIALSPTPPTYTAGQPVVFQAANSNTGPSTLAVNGQTPQNLVANGGAAFVGGEIVAGQIVAAVYDGTQFQMVGGGGGGLALSNTINEFRLTLTSGAPVPGDFAGGGSTVIYFTPYTGNRVALYNGSAWVVYETSEISIDFSTLSLADSALYDVFLYNDGGTLTLEIGSQWTDANNRAAALALQDGVYVLGSDATQRYLGTFYIESGGLCYDHIWGRDLYNVANRIPRTVSNVSGPTSTNSNGWGSIITLSFIQGVLGESYMLQGTALGQGDGVSASAEITVLAAEDTIDSETFNSIAGTIGTSYLSVSYCRMPEQVGLNNPTLNQRSSVDTTTVNLLDDGEGTNLTYLTGIAWM